MRTRTFFGLASSLTLLGIAQLLSHGTVSHRREPVRPDEAAYIGANIGLRPTTLITKSVEASSTTLSALSRGRCLFAVVYSRTCGASMNAARAWSLAARREALELPGDNWDVVWIADDPGFGASTALPEQFPVGTYEAVTDGELLAELDVRAWPVFVSLNRRGEIVSKGVGGPLPSEMSFSDDCSVRGK